MSCWMSTHWVKSQVNSEERLSVQFKMLPQDWKTKNSHRVLYADFNLSSEKKASGFHSYLIKKGNSRESKSLHCQDTNEGALLVSESHYGSSLSTPIETFLVIRQRILVSIREMLQTFLERSESLNARHC